jgi:flagellar biosynthesis/type III secretory pathway chaperone
MKCAEESIAQLIAVLTEELKVHENLVEIAQKMNDAIKRREIRDVQQQTQRYDVLVGRLEELEEQRLAACDAFAETGGQRHLTLTAIISTLKMEPQRGELSKLRSLLKEKLMALSRLNTANHILLEASLTIIAKNFELMLRTREKFQGYGHGGAATSRIVTRNFLNKIA